MWLQGEEGRDLPEAVLGSLLVLGNGSPVSLWLCEDHSGSTTENGR